MCIKKNKTRKTIKKTKTGETPVKMTLCPACHFQSDRAYNVTRHFIRIHTPCKRKINCCGEAFETKGEYYQHCADLHPGVRRSSFVRLQVYKIKNSREQNNITNEGTPANTQSQSATNKISYSWNSNTITYQKKKQLIKTKKEITKRDCQDPNKNRIRVFFKGDPKCPIYQQKQRDFLQDIDFGNFKI